MADANLEKEMEALRADLTQLRSDLSSVASALKEAGMRRAEGARESVSHLAEALGDELSAAFERVRERGKQSADTVEHVIEEKPVLSLLIALGLGVLVGRLLDRK